MVAVAPSQVMVEPLLLTAPEKETEEPDAGGRGGFVAGIRGRIGGARWPELELVLGFWLVFWLAFWRWCRAMSGRSRP